MELEKAKRYSSFIYWIPAIIIVVGRVPIPEIAFLALPIPYYAVFYFLYTKTEKSQRNQVELARIILVTLSHLVLYFMMFHQ